MMIKLSSIVYPNGRVWDHKGDKELVQIFISHDDRNINFLQFVYVENGTTVLSERPENSNHGKKFKTVKLNYPDEFLTSITGTYKTCGNDTVTSITFGTNKGSHGPFGNPNPSPSHKEFDFQMGQDRPFGGFHGSTNNLGDLESIGVYVKPITTLNNLNSAAGGGGKVKKERI